MSLTVVWLKHDLRVADHAPLFHAAQKGRVIPFYAIEPGYWRQPDTSLRQWQFVRETLLELDAQLSLMGQALWVAHDDVESCLTALLEQFGAFNLYVHQEFGNQWSRQRNRGVASWCESNNIDWVQFQPYGVVSGLESKEQWLPQWQQYMSQSVLPPPASLINTASTPLRPELWPEKLGYDQTACPSRLPGGRKAGLEKLTSFLKTRVAHYSGSSLLAEVAFSGSSRLSPYLRTGALSQREVVKQVARAEKHYASKGQESLAASTRVCLKRLQLHCHCIQQFEGEPAMELRSLEESYTGMREHEFDDALFQAWAEGKTGYPIIDAAMRALHEHGWINFRLRALLVSFASFHLWLHWREPALHLARLAIDYEPGIHYVNVQSQSGSANAKQWIIPDPVKQSQEIDPQGRFIKRHCPELKEVDGHLLHSPWLMSQGEQVINSCVLGEDYPFPVIDHLQAAELAVQKRKLWLAGNDDPVETI